MTAEDRTKDDVKALIDESLVYQRAYNRMLKLQYDMMAEANEQKRIARDAGEEPDKSYAVLKDDFAKLLDHYREVTDGLWSKSEQLSEKHDEGFFRLAQEIMKAAALDYEVALCGHGNPEAKSEQRRIEDFARNRASYYTTLNFESVLERIRNTHPIFVRTCKDNAKTIRDETKAARRAKKSVESNTVRCPLCGRPLYAWGKLNRRDVVIRCTGCAFQETVVVDDGKA